MDTVMGTAKGVVIAIYVLALIYVTVWAIAQEKTKMAKIISWREGLQAGMCGSRPMARAPAYALQKGRTFSTLCVMDRRETRECLSLVDVVIWSFLVKAVLSGFTNFKG